MLINENLFCRHRLWLVFILVLLLAEPVQSQSQTNPRAEWFVDARFGMFIHWGLYSGAEGIWKGERLRNDNDYAEWIFYRNRIDKQEYLTLIDRFDWEEIDPEEWVLLAKRSGMKYVTLTAKHHDGFALWNSKVSEYDVYDHTEPHRDIVAELAAACQKHGLKMGLYYSHWVDWEHEYGWDHTMEIYPISAEQYDQYWQEKVMPQMRELLTNYGPIGLIWFDMWIDHSETIISKNQLLQLKNMIRELQPETLVNSRIGLSLEEDPDVDFRTLGDNQLGDQKLDYPWQSPGTVAHSWGFNQLDTEWKSTTALLKALIGNVSLNGNYMLNIGPRSDGSVPYEISQRMLEMGEWLAVNGEAIYHSGAFDLPKDQHDWGKITYKSGTEGKHKLFLHLYNWPYNGRLPVTGITSRPEKAYLLSDKMQSPLSFSFQGPFVEVELPAAHPDNLIPVVVLEFDRKPEITEELVAKTTDGGYTLLPEAADSVSGSNQYYGYAQRGNVPPHMLVKDQFQADWKIYVDQPGAYQVDVSYSFQGEKSAGNITVSATGQTISHEVSPTGLTVVEPNRKYHVEDFESHRIGTFRFEKAGIYDIQTEIDASGKNPVRFQWLWLQKSQN